MKILIVGGGGREHALAWKATQSKGVTQVFVAPGNAGTALEDGIENVDIGAEDINALIAFAQQEQITLTIVGPEAPLVTGIVDQFNAEGLRCFGPSQAAAQLEGSKVFCKDFFARHNIPTAAYQNFTEVEPACDYVRQQGTPIVIKADGLAAGKGVIIAQTEAEAFETINDMLAGNAFGEAGHRVVIEEFLEGEEASFIVIANGAQALPMATSQDHKARDNGDLGPNTGGMGAYSPAPVVTPKIHQQIMDNIIQPTLDGMIKDGTPYSGFLYAGVMIDKKGIAKTLEFNCRFGDPETQPIMMRLKSDLVELCNAAIDNRLDKTTSEWDERSALGVVLAAGGYPFHYDKGDTINGISSTTEDGKVFHAGTAFNKDNVVTQGGRVLCACALGGSISEAQQKAYKITEQIQWNNVYYRTDIGYRAIARENTGT
ncbi:MAG: phosphoribosylamine--glycine ligase [Cycloclasticus sp. symbiont of Poecilosclerida sp. M]|nr:MAG: phosphoribosylamine--glycine ligase [Cycloclasticus sp. symbiont of Poecilosclerida sp. M]